MREVFAHDAVLRMAPHADASAPGAAITVALCGSWQHEPPCPLAPHHTTVERDGDQVRLRVLFATEPQRARDVRERIEQALAAGTMRGPADYVTEWWLQESKASSPRAQEGEHGRRLVVS